MIYGRTQVGAHTAKVQTNITPKLRSHDPKKSKIQRSEKYTLICRVIAKNGMPYPFNFTINSMFFSYFHVLSLFPLCFKQNLAILQTKFSHPFK